MEEVQFTWEFAKKLHNFGQSGRREGEKEADLEGTLRGKILTLRGRTQMKAPESNKTHTFLRLLEVIFRKNTYFNFN
jgi:hypothetical protein